MSTLGWSVLTAMAGALGGDGGRQDLSSLRTALESELGLPLPGPAATEPETFLRQCETVPGALHVLADLLGDEGFRAQVRAVPVPLLLAPERRALLALLTRAAHLPVAGPYRAAVGGAGPDRPAADPYRAAVGGTGPDRPAAGTARELLPYLEGLLRPPERPPPLLTFVAALAAEAGAGLRADLRTWLEAHLARTAAPADWLAALTPGAAARGSRTVLVLRVERDWLGDGYLVAAWSQAEDGAPGIGIAAAEAVVAEPDLPAEADRLLAAVFAAHASDANDVTVECILPKSLGNLPVDQWPVGAAFGAEPLPLGARHSVVLRSWERGVTRALRPYWTRKSKRLRAHGHLSDPKAVFFLDRPEPNLAALGAQLWEEPRICFMQEFPPGEEPTLAADELGVALSMGLPVAVWCRPGFDPDAEGRLDDLLDVSSVAELPGLVLRLRREAARALGGEPRPGRHLALLWDEAGRWPEEPAARWQAPDAEDRG
ncbi:hypothetical protein [Dactylosporangium sp. CS-033363]|uniref:VMAP-C domain-containing protein n=1 Tax=Dactylosporangium sp. CS-033363 TaxID=3239935 RepID=UPI003D8CD999